MLPWPSETTAVSTVAFTVLPSQSTSKEPVGGKFWPVSCTRLEGAPAAGESEMVAAGGGVAEGVGEGVAVGVAVGDAVGVAVGVGVGTTLGEGIGLEVGVPAGVGVPVGEGLATASAVSGRAPGAS